MDVVAPIAPSGAEVDWWFAYKLPKLAASDGCQESTGYEYVYYDPVDGEIHLEEVLLTDPDSALNRTIQHVYGEPGPTIGWILYNDEMPKDAEEPDAGRFGHTKGVLAFDTASGSAIWLLHSWPRFADPKSEDLPVATYGQTFLCLSIDIATAETLAQQMIDHQEPQVYLCNVPASLEQDSPLRTLAAGSDPNAAGESSVIECTTRGGLPFKVIAKNRKWGKDFWIDLVGPTLAADLDVETWIRGPVPPVCDSDGVHHVADVKYIDLRPLGVPYLWSETRDHAKWGRTLTDDWLCVGDINRMISQEKRGGGTIAFRDPRLWSALSKVDLLVPPPGCTIEDVKRSIKASHSSPSV